jgi:hypothetical protein
MDDQFSSALGMSYEFRDDKIIFSDGVSYTLDEAASLARDRLTDMDLQAIHLVKKMFDGEILDCAGETRRLVRNGVGVTVGATVGATESVARTGDRSLDDLAAEFGPPPIMKK